MVPPHPTSRIAHDLAHLPTYTHTCPVQAVASHLTTFFTIAIAGKCDPPGVTGGRCICDPGRKGDECGELDLGAASPVAYGLASVDTPTWGGGAVFEAGRWHLIVGSHALDVNNNTKEDSLAIRRSSGLSRQQPIRAVHHR